MLRRFTMLLVIFLSVLVCIQSWAYTVILKNGKVIKGTLISEDDVGLVFKDEKGFQFSLKKSALDLDKMKESNAAPPPAAPVPEKPAEVAPEKKAAKMYTAADLEHLRDRYGPLATSEAVTETDPSESPDAYYAAITNAVGRISTVSNDLSSLMDGMNTDWEVATSTGRDPVASLQKYKSGKGYTDISKEVSGGIAGLQSLNDSLQSPPKGMESAPDSVGKSVEALSEYFGAVQRYAGNPPMASFRASVQKYADAVDAALSDLQKIEAPAAAKQ